MMEVIYSLINASIAHSSVGVAFGSTLDSLSFIITTIFLV
jgi:hypothetical protein